MGFYIYNCTAEALALGLVMCPFFQIGRGRGGVGPLSLLSKALSLALCFSDHRALLTLIIPSLLIHSGYTCNILYRKQTSEIKK